MSEPPLGPICHSVNMQQEQAHPNKNGRFLYQVPGVWILSRQLGDWWAFEVANWWLRFTDNIFLEPFFKVRDIMESCFKTLTLASTSLGPSKSYRCVTWSKLFKLNHSVFIYKEGKNNSSYLPGLFVCEVILIYVKPLEYCLVKSKHTIIVNCCYYWLAFFTLL